MPGHAHPSTHPAVPATGIQNTLLLVMHHDALSPDFPTLGINTDNAESVDAKLQYTEEGLFMFGLGSKDA
jgi:hypothetical protein